jgi:hypothetical protein
MRFLLRRPEGTCTFYKITSGRRWVGRVCQHEDGTWLGVMGKTMLRGYRSPEEAFDAVVASHLGYQSADALRARNARVRQARQLSNMLGDVLADDVARGDFSRVDKLGLPGLTMALQGFTRSLRKGRRR